MGISKAYGMARAQRCRRDAQRRPHRRHDGRRRAAGRPDLGIAAAGRQRAARRDHRHRRSQQAAVGFGGVRRQRSRPDRGQVPRVRVGGAARRRPRSARRPRRVRAVRRRSRSAEGAHRRHDQGQGRVVHGRPRVRRRDVPLPRRCAEPQGLPGRRRRDRRTRQRAPGRAEAARDRAAARAAARCASRRRSPSGSWSRTATNCSQIARTRPDIVVLDADLLSDCGIEAFKAELPERFIECGIAEQHMVSAAGGMALRGLLPVVHSFACFLSTRANEHIYNNATERRKIIYTATLAGAVPGGPGTLASVRSRYLGDRLGARASPRSNRAASASRGWPSGGPSSATPRARICGSSTCRSTFRTRCRRRTRSRSDAACTLRDGARRRDRRLRSRS